MNEMRRKLLGLGVLTVVSTALPLEMLGQYAAPTAAKATSSSPSANQYEALSFISREDLQQSVGATFDIQGEASGFTRVVLTEVGDLRAQSQARHRAALAITPSESFTVRFKFVSGPSLKQGTYLFETSSLIRFALFVVPSSPKTGPVYYTAHVNRLAR